MTGEGSRSGVDVSTAAAARQGSAAVAESAGRLLEQAPDGVASTVLPMVLSDVPVAILLIDVGTQTVTYANRTAVEMAADQRLPVPLDQWGAAAGLTDLGGAPLASTANPLSRLATGHPLAGEPVLAPGGAGRPRTLWVTGFSLGAGEEHLALVVLFEVAAPPGVQAGAEETLLQLRERAIVATDLAFTITDPRQEDNPLVWVNPAFTRVTGYAPEDSVGRNCRFLQGPATDRAVVAELRTEIEAGRPVTRTVLNYRKDGTAFWNQVAISPVFDGDDNLVSFVGVQGDVTERVRAEIERERAFVAEQVARRDAERARGRLSLLADAGGLLSSALRGSENLALLADLVVRTFADWVLITLADGDGVVTQRIAQHRHGRHELLERYREAGADLLEGQPLVRRVVETGEPIWMSGEEWEELRRSHPTPTSALAAELGVREFIVVPLVARHDEIPGTMTFVIGESDREFTDEDLQVAVELGRRAGLTLDNARLYERDHHTSMTLQASLLPDQPSVDGLEIGTTYLAGSDSADVGGDWYEVLPLPDGTVGVAVGDVVGHDLSAAAAMGHLRGLLRASAWIVADDGEADPAQVVRRADRLVQGLHVVPMATMVFGQLERPGVPGGPWRLSWSNAGHPPPLLRLPDGTINSLDGAHGLLLGVARDAPRVSASIEVPAGSILLAFTDGLIERRGELLDVGLARVANALRAVDAGLSMPRLVPALVAAVGPAGSDDTAVLGIRVGAR